MMSLLTEFGVRDRMFVLQRCRPCRGWSVPCMSVWPIRLPDCPALFTDGPGLWSHVPQGHPRIAQRFSAGFGDGISQSPVGKKELRQGRDSTGGTISVVPAGLGRSTSGDPVLKHWAIVARSLRDGRGFMPLVCQDGPSGCRTVLLCPLTVLPERRTVLLSCPTALPERLTDQVCCRSAQVS